MICPGTTSLEYSKRICRAGKADYNAPLDNQTIMSEIAGVACSAASIEIIRTCETAILNDSPAVKI